MALDQLRAQIRRAIIPVADLVLDRQPQGALIFPDDIPPVLAILAGSDAKGNPKLVVTNSDGTIGGGGGTTKILDSTGANITNANPFPVNVENPAGSAPVLTQIYTNQVLNPGNNQDLPAFHNVTHLRGIIIIDVATVTPSSFSVFRFYGSYDQTHWTQYFQSSGQNNTACEIFTEFGPNMSKSNWFAPYLKIQADIPGAAVATINAYLWGGL